MELVVTESIFLWYFGITAFLLVVILILVVFALIYAVKILKFVKDKSITVGETVDVVQRTVRHTAESVDDVQNKIAQFFNFSMTAKSISSLIANVRSAWDKPKEKSTEEIQDIFEDIDIKETGKDNNG